MRLGANRLLVVGLRHEHADDAAHQRAREQAKTIYPNAVFMGGKLLDALMLDKLEADLRRIERLNEIIDAGIGPSQMQPFGPHWGFFWASSIRAKRFATVGQLALGLVTAPPKPHESLYL